ncbi:MAG TPA: DinB family protein [Fodinibius sp.]|nr:DinB family protein [Fodinibius sp.]
MDNPSLKQLTDHLAMIYDGDPWYGHSIQAVLQSVDPTCAFDSPGNGTHPIAELVAHIITWREFTGQRLRGESEHLPDQEASFDWKQFSNGKNDVWDNLISTLNDSQTQLLLLLRRQDDAILNQRVAGKPYTFHYLLTGLLQHDVYHLGQIAYIQKLMEQQKRPAPGLLKYSYKIFPFENLALQK